MDLFDVCVRERGVVSIDDRIGILVIAKESGLTGTSKQHDSNIDKSKG